MTEREKMHRGEWYDANNDTVLLRERAAAEQLCFEFNNTPPRDTKAKEEVLNRLLPDKGREVVILAPFYTDYGYNCHLGDNVFINHNAYLMDGGRITIEDNVFIGPNCGIYTAEHPLLAAERNQGVERALPVTIGADVWIGADVTILPGVTIGAGSVIGAKSVVTKNIPEGVIAVGNPCRVLRKITDADGIKK